MTDRDNRIEVSLKKRTTVFENSRFRVFSDHIADSGGNEVQDYLVVAPKVTTDRLVTGVTVLPVIDDHVVLLRTFRHPIRRMVLEAPRGFIDTSETPRAAALRELAEETGLTCEPDQLIDLGTCFPEAGMIAAQVALFAALDCRTGIRTAAGEIGLGNCVRISLLEVKRLVADMAIEDATTALCLHRFFMTRKGGPEPLL